MKTKITALVIVLLSIGLVTSFARIHSLKRHAAEAGELRAERGRLTHELTEARAALRAAAEPEVPVVPPPIPKADPEPQSAAPRPAAERDAELIMLLGERDRQISDLSLELVTVTNSLAAAKKQIEDAARAREERRNRFMERSRQRLEELKETDPERYEQIQEQRRNRRERMTDTLARQSAFVINMDADAMNEDQRRNHERLAEVMAENWTCMETIRTQPETDEAGQARRTLRNNMSEMRNLFSVERETALLELGRDMGYDGQDGKAFSETVKEIYDMTSLGSYWRRQRPQRPQAARQGVSRRWGNAPSRGTFHRRYSHMAGQGVFPSASMSLMY